MKSLLIILFTLGCVNAYGNLLLRCRDGVTLQDCADRVERTLTELGCELDPALTDCSFGVIDDPSSDQVDAVTATNTPLCQVKSVNCSHTQELLFSLGESCRNSQLKVTIPTESEVTNNYWQGIWAPYSRAICVNK